MIVYFSGTGNSLVAAQRISEMTHDTLVSVAQERLHAPKVRTYHFKSGQRLGLVFPVYAWAAPDMVYQWLRDATFEWEGDPYIYCVITCGESIGNAMTRLAEALQKKGLTLHAGFSLVMPNNYVIIGDVYDEPTKERLLKTSEDKLMGISQSVLSFGQGLETSDRGRLPLFLTDLIARLFNRFARTTKAFKVDPSCNQCGICAKVCPTQTITMKETPVWGQGCAQCLACLHFCPQQAIQYGEKTRKKGRYTHPKITWQDMKLQ